MKTFVTLALCALLLAGCGTTFDLGPVHVNCMLPQNLDHEQVVEPIPESVIKDATLPAVTEQLKVERAKRREQADEYNSMHGFVKEQCK